MSRHTLASVHTAAWGWRSAIDKSRSVLLIGSVKSPFQALLPAVPSFPRLKTPSL